MLNLAKHVSYPTNPLPLLPKMAFIAKRLAYQNSDGKNIQKKNSTHLL